MKMQIVFALLLALCAGLCAAEAPKPEFTLQVRGELVIAPDG